MANPFQLQRQNLASQLFGSAGIFGQQNQGFLSSRGMFDANLAEAGRMDAFGKATSALSLGLTNLAGQEATFGEGQRQFDLSFGEGQRQFDITADFQQQQLDLRRRELDAELKAGRINVFDYIQAIAGLATGTGNILSALFPEGIGGG